MSKRVRIPKLILKWIGIVILSIIAILLILWLALQFPAVQNRIADRATRYLEEKIETPVSIGEIDIDFFSRLQLKEVYLEDQKGDTLLYAGSVAAQLGLFAPFQQEIYVDDFELHDAVGKLYRGPDSTFNFQFILEAFAGPPKADTTSSSGSWTFGLDNILLDDVRFQMLDSLAKTSLYTRIGTFAGDVDGLQLEEQQITIASVDFTNSYASFSSWAASPDTTEAASDSSALEFPFTGWDIRIEEAGMKGLGFSYNDFSQPPAPAGQFDPAHLEFENIALYSDGFRWDSTELQLQLQQLSFRELNGFQLDSLQGSARMSTTGIALEDLLIRTPQSRLAPSDASLRFDEFAGLADFVNKVNMNIQLRQGAIALSDIRYWTGPIPNFEEDARPVFNIEGQVLGTVDSLTVRGLNFGVGKDTRLRAYGRVYGLPDVEELEVNVRINQAQTSYRELQRLTKGIELPEGLRGLGRFRLNAILRGQIDDLTASPLQLRTESATSFDGRLQATGLPDVEELRFQLYIDEFRTAARDIRNFTGDELPVELQELGQVSYSGRVSGTAYQFDIDGQLQSGAGRSQQDLQIEFSPDYANASYQGKLSLDQLELGKLLANPALGPTSLELQAEGSGLDPDSLHLQLDGTISQFSFRGYDYQDILLDGRLDGRRFEGDLNIDDPNLRFNFSGLANLNDSLPQFRFSAKLDSANLQELKLYSSPLHLETDMRVELTGAQLDRMEGFALLKDFVLRSPSGRYETDSMRLRAEKTSPDRRLLAFESDIAYAKIAGKYELALISEAVLDYADTFFPVRRWVGSDTARVDTAALPLRLERQAFELEIGLDRPTRLTEVFLPTLTGIDTAWVQANFQDSTGVLDLSGFVPSLEYGNFMADSITLSADGGNRKLEVAIGTKRFRTDERTFVQEVNASTSFYNNSMRLQLNARGDTIEQLLQVNALLQPTQDGTFALSLLSPFFLSGEQWSVADGNQLVMSDSTLRAENFRITKSPQAIFLQGGSSRSNPLRLGFEQFQLSEIARLAQMEADYLSGSLNGKVKFQQADSTMVYEADLGIQALTLDQYEIGRLNFTARPLDAGQRLRLSAQLSGNGNDLQAQGTYGMEEGALDFAVSSSGLQLEPVDFFTFGSTKNSRGRVRADLSIEGTATAPMVTGSIGMDSASTFVTYLQTRFLVPNHTVNLEEGLVDIGSMRLVDNEGRPARLSGQIMHDQFDDIEFDLRFRSSSFLVLDTERGDNELYYGKILVDADASITGPLELPQIDVTTTTLPGTALTVLPVSEEKAIVQEDFIIYGTPEAYRQDTSEQAENLYQTNESGFDLDLRLNLTPDARLTAVIDPSTGDQLTARGRANILVEMDPGGQLTTTGNISLTEGSYFLNYQGLVKRTFNIQSGSTVYLPGDPLNSRFDITARYTTEAPVYALLEAQSISLDESQTQAARRRQPIIVLMNMEGTLSEPAISFELEPGSELSGSIVEEVNRKFNALDQTELNKQVFGLLLFNSFLTSSGGGSLATTGENIALSSVSNLLSNQLNQLADRYVEGVDLNFGVNSYTTAQSEATITEVELGVSKSLLNDRLTVEVGGNLGVNDERSSQNTTTAIAGDFLLEYKLTEDGSYRLRVFRRPDYDVFTDGIRTGASIRYQTSFGDLRPDSTQTNPD